MTVKDYLRSDKLSSSAVITSVQLGETPIVRLDNTLFHPQGGGQRGDRGFIGPARVLDTRHAEGGEVDHFVDRVDALTIGDRVDIEVDALHRRQGAQLHSAGHLIAEAAQALKPGLRAVAGHHWKGEARVEFEGAVEVDPAFATDLAQKLCDLAADALPVTVMGEPFTCRAVQIGDFEPVGCGGTHVKTTAELTGIRLTGIRTRKGRLRISYDLD